MATAAYGTDLLAISQAEEASGTWAEPTATGWTSLSAIVFQENEFVLQSTYCVAGTLKVGVGGVLADAGASGVTIPTDGAFLVWAYFAAPNLLDTHDNGGMRVMCGGLLNGFYWVKAGGKDVDPNPYGGWQMFAMADPGAITVETAVGTPGTTRRYFGWAYNCPTAVPTKGNPFGVDVLRYGRCESRFSGGTSPDAACTFAGYAAVNDASANRYGLISAVPGGYKWRGLMTFGYGAAAVRFTDQNTLIVVAQDNHVTVNFSKIEIRVATSEINWTAISFVSLGGAAKGRLEVVDDADVNILNCSFTDMDTFIFKAASGVLACTFRRCNTITANDANFTGTLFDAASVALNTSQLIWNVATNPSSDLTGCTFTKGALAHHAIEFGTSSPTAITLTNMTFTGFNASNSQNDSALHFKRTSGTITVTLSGTSQPSYKAEGTTTVEWVTSSRTVKVAVSSVSGPVTGANVMLLAADGGPFPYNDTVTITRSGTTATVAHTGHGMATNDQVLISGITDKIADNIPHTITRTSDDAYTFTTTDSGSTSYTGTIKCTFIFLKGIADAGTNSNEISMSRSIPSTQPVTGWARKSSGAPYYKQGIISGNVVSTGDTTFSPVLIADA